MKRLILLTLMATILSVSCYSQTTKNMKSQARYAFAQSEKVTRQKVEFKNRYGITLVADLYVPKQPEDNKLAAIAVKVCSLSGSLTTSASNPGTIRAGDIMLYGANSLVLFYETFSTSYSYTRIGRIDPVSGLKSALGRGDITVKFELEEHGN